MKYGESSFDILYLLFAITTGFIVLIKRKDSIGRLMGLAALILGCGDAFHLVPRVLNYFLDYDFTAWLGVGKLITSITMTIFYLLLFFLHTKLYIWENEKEQKQVMVALFLMVGMRISICLLPGNRWLQGGTSVGWGILRNISFVAIGILMVVLFYQRRNENENFKRMWIYITLSFLFYIPVAVFASLVPMLGMLMLPKTVCYILMLVIFLKESKNKKLTYEGGN
ncbi:MAG: hypothetical protein IKO32_08135 [Lachnospiraceae bacterium]|nr:hypothetical protein [Lachnospiraceae bacterium]